MNDEEHRFIMDNYDIFASAIFEGKFAMMALARGVWVINEAVKIVETKRFLLEQRLQRARRFLEKVDL